MIETVITPEERLREISLYSKSIEYQFSDKEKEFLKKCNPKYKYKIHYCIYTTISKKGNYIGLFLDQQPRAVRRSPVFNTWKIIYTRELTDLEYDEVISNFGFDNRRFKVWQYKSIERLIKSDLLYDIKTPKEFIDKCISLGYTEKENKKTKI